MNESLTTANVAKIPDDVRDFLATLGRGEPPAYAYLLALAIPAPVAAMPTAAPGIINLQYMVIGHQATEGHFSALMTIVMENGLKAGLIAFDAPVSMLSVMPPGPVQ